MSKPEHAATIEAAIRDRQRLEFNYRGYGRVVEPSAVGVTHQGVASLRGYQVAGASSSGTVDGRSPKLWDLGLIRDLRPAGEAFTPNAGYRQGDSAFAVIWAEL